MDRWGVPRSTGGLRQVPWTFGLCWCERGGGAPGRRPHVGVVVLEAGCCAGGFGTPAETTKNTSTANRACAVPGSPERSSCLLRSQNRSRPRVRQCIGDCDRQGDHELWGRVRSEGRVGRFVESLERDFPGFVVAEALRAEHHDHVVVHSDGDFLARRHDVREGKQILGNGVGDPYAEVVAAARRSTSM
jgi:hypothetical protein